jgi:hypothetical protein
MQEEDHPSLTEAYEREVLEAFQIWYWQQTQPTIDEASTQALRIARHTVVRGLTTNQVIVLLQEHSEWIHQPPQETYQSDKDGGMTIGEVARRHLVKHLQQIIQKKGLQAAFLPKEDAENA